MGILKVPNFDNKFFMIPVYAKEPTLLDYSAYLMGALARRVFDF